MPCRANVRVTPEVSEIHNPAVISFYGDIFRDVPEGAGAMSTQQTSLPHSFVERADAFLHVLHALMLRDMRTRFGGSHWGYAITVLWPVVHVFVLVTIMTFRGLPAPLGHSTILFIATGAVPFFQFQYLSRFVMQSLIANRPLTYYPQVKLFDVLISRILVEICGGFLGLMVVLVILSCLGIDVMPPDYFEAVLAYTAALLFGIGFGAVNVAVVSFFPGWVMGYMLFSIVMYMVSGVFFMPSMLPSEIYTILKYVPTVQIIEWMRSAYYPEANLEVDKFYTVMFALSMLATGLGFQRFWIARSSI